MSRIARIFATVALGTLAAGPIGCKDKEGASGTTAPGETGASGAGTAEQAGPKTDARGEPIPQLPPGASEAPKMVEKSKVDPGPLPQDRDPEEERRKMEASKAISAKAKSALRSGNLTRAIEEARQALRAHEQNVEAMLVISEAFFKQGKWEIAQGVATATLEVDSRVLTPEESSQAYNLRGFAYLAEGRRETARKMFRSAAELDSKNATAWNNLGVQYMLDGDWDTAATCFKYATEVSPSFLKAQLNYGTALRGQGKLLEAEAQFSSMLQQKPSYAAAYFNLGVLYLDADPYPNMDTKGRYNKAIQQFTKYKELAISQGHKSADDDRLVAMDKAMLSSLKLVSPGQADLYIEVAKKGIEREIRKEERDARRKEKEAKKAAREAEKAAKAKDEAAENPPADGGGEGSGDGESGAAADPQKPGEKNGGDSPDTQKPGGGSQA